MPRNPKLSIIIPSFNQGEYLEETLLSVIDQNYPNLELIVIDGGSTDGSVEIIQKFESDISYWVSEKDGGQAHAINKGLAVATGDFVAYMNSDDQYYPNAFEQIFSTLPKNADFIHGPVRTGESPDSGIDLGIRQPKKLKPARLLKFFYKIDFMIPSQSVFIRRSFLEQTNQKFLDESLHFCLDMEWYFRIIAANAKIFQYTTPRAFFRYNNTTKTGSQNLKMEQEAVQIMYSKLRELGKKEKDELLNTLLLHRILKKIWSGKIKMSLKGMLKIIPRLPLMAWTDTRFLGLVKKAMLSKS